MNRSNSGFHAHGQGSTGPRPRTIFLGVDADGSEHVYKTESESVHVVENGDRVWRRDLAGVHVDEWVAHITDRRGWDTKLYGAFWDRVSAAVEEAL